MKRDEKLIQAILRLLGDYERSSMGEDLIHSTVLSELQNTHFYPQIVQHESLMEEYSVEVIQYHITLCVEDKLLLRSNGIGELGREESIYALTTRGHEYLKHMSDS